jgi:hypothetical protein
MDEPAQTEPAQTEPAQTEPAQTDVVVIGMGPGGEYAAGTLQVAVRAEVPVATLRNMPYAYPTFHHAIEDAPRHLDLS